ncbi:putative 4-deoxy-4-formamido-L-arabinose-phosphoundecaprenol deformylase ArnD [bioreactor metagenome]|uniref:Putative 4-deoxy-4-formamido-L-arabinose-phosphoundecaprenol deformylase ArnD n=1 Tax=bioreactor metagenome TaxID=1076179 RepID=A0A645C7M7_9ZZZZ
MLTLKEKFHFRYNSDCRGETIFLPVVDGTELSTPQIPLSMPTYDELLGRNGVAHANYNEKLLEFASPDKMNLLTVHAEVEGGVCAGMFEEFLHLAAARGIELVPPGALLPAGGIPPGRIVQREIPGREGILAVQESALV